MLETKHIVGYAADFNPSYTRNEGKENGHYKIPSYCERLKSFFSNLFYKVKFYIDAYRSSEPESKKIKLLYATCIEAEAKLDAAECQELLGGKPGSLDRLKVIQKEFFDAINALERARNKYANTTPFNCLMMYYAHNMISPQDFERSKHKLNNFPEGNHMHCDDLKFFFKDYGGYDDHREFIATVDKPVDHLIESMKGLRLQLRSGYKHPIAHHALSQFRDSWNEYVNSHAVLKRINAKVQDLPNSYKWEDFLCVVK